jgi:hypothetical protein
VITDDGGWQNFVTTENHTITASTAVEMWTDFFVISIRADTMIATRVSWDYPSCLTEYAAAQGVEVSEIMMLQQVVVLMEFDVSILL